MNQISPLQIFSGYQESDLDLLRSFSREEVRVLDDHYYDGFGVRTLLQCIPFAKTKDFNLERLKLPVPDDGFHAETIEYLSLIEAISWADPKKPFCTVELGAGWGPWITLAGVLTRKKNFGSIKLVGVEADQSRFDLLKKHLASNALRPFESDCEDTQHEEVHTRLFNGAAWVSDGNAFFPETAITDMGTAVTSDPQELDYRGMEVKYGSTECRSLKTLLSDLVPINYLHVDLQGGEHTLIENEIDWISENVMHIFVATHSRLLEGKIIDLFHSEKWNLLREKPCRFQLNKQTNNTVGCTTVDGGQFWSNNKFNSFC
tara:strand:- start:8616 stop:9566 length:951 start_codon:yes stop_codon:yes gene_type:complete